MNMRMGVGAGGGGDVCSYWGWTRDGVNKLGW